MRITDLADVLRAAGLTVIEQGGWKTRGRTADGGHYVNDQPDHVMVHHTASFTTPEADTNYMSYNSPVSPIANLYIQRDNGHVWVLAAGPTNTNGAGADTWGGGVANNNMNRHAIGIEMANRGTGEPYSDAMQDSVLTTVKALMAAYSVPVGQVRAHFEWSPGRKIDPYGPSRWGNEKWDMDAFRGDCAATTPPPQPPPTEDEIMYLFRHADYADWFCVGGGALHLGPGLYNQLVADGAKQIVSNDLNELDYVCAAAGWPRSALKEL